MAEVLFRAKLTRDGTRHPWGFRLQGGVEYDKPLTLLKVVEGSLACKGGLHPGDIVVKLAGKCGGEMTHKDAQEAIISAGNALEIIVERADVTMTTIQTPSSTTTSVTQAKSDQRTTMVTKTSTTTDIPSANQGGDNTTTDILPANQGRDNTNNGSENCDNTDMVSKNLSAALPNDTLAINATYVASEASATGPDVATSKHKLLDTSTLPSPHTRDTLDNAPNVDILDSQGLDNGTGDPAPVSELICDTEHIKHETLDLRQDADSSRSASEALETAVNVNSIISPTPDAFQQAVTLGSETEEDSGATSTTAVVSSSEETASMYSDISKVSVINEFQSADTTAVVQRNAKMAPSSTLIISSSTSDETLHSPATPSQTAHIPHSSPVASASVSSVTSASCVTSSPSATSAQYVTVAPSVIAAPYVTSEQTNKSAPPVTSCSDAPTITMLVTEVPKMTIQATPVDTRPSEQSHISPTDLPTQLTISTSDIHIHSSSTSPVFLPGEGTSRQTGAPTEEIMIAPKPSIQIMSSPEIRETVQVPNGDKRSDQSEWESEENSEEGIAPLVTHERKDFSKTAPWRMHKQTSPGRQSSPRNQAALHPWRKSRTEHAMSHSLDDRQLSAAASRQIPGFLDNSATTDTNTDQSNVLTQHSVSEMDISTTRPQSILTYVGKRIESPPVGSPVQAGTPFFKVSSAAPTIAPPPEGRDVTPSERSNTIPPPHTTQPSTSEPISMLLPEPTSEVYCPPPEEIHFQAAAPDLVDIPMPAVKEMVDDLNLRLEHIAVQHPKIVEPTDSQELGLNYYKQSGTNSSGLLMRHGDINEQEIIIDMPPNPNFTGTSLDEIKQRLFGHPGYIQVYELLDPGALPSSHRRRYSLPGGSVTQRHNQRKVRFAEPPESSVIEIEPRQKRLIERLERRRMWDDDGCMSDMEDYSSAPLLAAKLDRIERENALSTASFQRHRNAKQRAQSLSSHNAQTKPTESFRDKVISFESLGGESKQDDVVVSSMKPSTRDKFAFGTSRSGSRGFSLSIGQTKPGSISLSLTHQTGSGHPAQQVSLAVPSTEGHFTYTISPQTGSLDPVAVRYNVPSHMVNEPMVNTATGQHVKASSLDSARIVHIQYPPQEGVPTIHTQLLGQTSDVNPLSPPQQVMRQLAGRPGIRSPTNYSNTLQIDTSSRLQHRSPSPPNPSYPPNIQSDRSHLSPQMLVQPQPKHPDTATGEYQTQRPTSPIGIKVRQPSPTNPMAYQTSASPQGIIQYGPPTPRPLSPQYHQSTGPHGSMPYHPGSPRPVSPINFPQQPGRAHTGSSLGYQRPPSPQGTASLIVPQAGPYQQPAALAQPRLNMRPAKIMQPPAYGMQQQLQQPISPIQHVRPSCPPYANHIAPGTNIHRNTPPRQMAVPGTPPIGSGMPAGSMVGGNMLGGAMMGGAMPGQLMRTDSPVPGVPPMMSPSSSGAAQSGGKTPGLFALFDRRFTEKFLQWNEDRPGDLSRSETYKLVHEMDDHGDDL